MHNLTFSITNIHWINGGNEVTYKKALPDEVAASVS